MHKKLKRYLFASAMVLPIGGFFIFFQYFSATKTVRTVQAVNEAAAQPEPAQEVSAAKIETAIVPVESNNATEEIKVTTAPKQCDYPAQILNLAAWKQTLPTGSSKKPTEISPATLVSYSEKSYFKTNSNCDGVVFRAPVNGVTTSGSGYPRSELREMSADGKNLASWSTTSGTHTMTIDEAITAIPKNKKHVVAGQIHDANDDVVVIRLEYPKLFVDINGKPGPVLDSNYTLGKRFNVKFEASGGQIKIFYNNSSIPVFAMKKSGSGNYFKAGAYTQSNCSKEKDCSADNFGEVVIYNLSVQH